MCDPKGGAIPESRPSPISHTCLPVATLEVILSGLGRDAEHFRQAMNVVPINHIFEDFGLPDSETLEFPSVDGNLVCFHERRMVEVSQGEDEAAIHERREYGDKRHCPGTLEESAEEVKGCSQIQYWRLTVCLGDDPLKKM